MFLTVVGNVVRFKRPEKNNAANTVDGIRFIMYFIVMSKCSPFNCNNIINLIKSLYKKNEKRINYIIFSINF